MEPENSPENNEILRKFVRAVFGAPKHLKDTQLFHKMALIPILAWVGLGADGLSSSAYGPEEAFRALGQHTYLAVFLGLATALTEIEGANGWFKGQDPSFLQQMSLVSINTPIRIGRAVVMPGDVVLAKKYGVIFIPAHLVEDLVITAEVTALRDKFAIQRLREKKYLAGQIDSEWTDEIKNDFMNWLKSYPGKLPMNKEELDKYFKERNW